MRRSEKRHTRLAEAKRIAREEYGGDVTWRKLSKDHPELEADLTSYELRRIKGDFITWMWNQKQTQNS